ncbi:MAG: helix-turn-helix transcriptional regulator [Clostridia bacterium]|nr:helix-turn-helix transcriptional regulator [Clostridia bacterium]
MTVGEKIQIYRKRIGLSQEELAQRILVSRQTISSWEMDKTLPTIDNLLRLKEVFGVSIDDILSESPPAEERRETPRETYTFQYSAEEMEAFYRKGRLPWIKRIVLCIGFGIMLLIGLLLIEAHGIIIGVAEGFCLVLVIAYIKEYKSYKKIWRLGKSKIPEETYSYEVYDQYFALKVFKNEELRRTQKIFFGDIGKIDVFGSYMILQISGQGYLIKKDDLDEDSAFLSLYKEVSERTKVKKPTDLMTLLSILLFLLALGSIYGGLTVASYLIENHHYAMLESLKALFLFLPVPIASILFGFYLKKKGYKYNLNVVGGLSIALFLCVFGSFSFLFGDTYSHDDAPILRVEQALEIDIPTHTHITTQDWTKGEQNVSRGYIYSSSDIYFDEDSSKEFERGLLTDGKWLSDIPSEMIGITSDFCDIQVKAYYIIYNTDTKELNRLPQESGTYAFVNVLYYPENEMMRLVEYQIEYTAP